jgi:hypothetical protein
MTMANGFICLQSQKSTDPAPFENKQIIADTDIDRVATWAAVTYLPNGVPNGDGTFRAATGQDAFAALTAAVYADVKAKVEQWYLAQAEAAARASVQPIVLTPAS